MPGTLSNLFSGDDGAEGQGATQMPISSIEGAPADDGDNGGAQHAQSFDDHGDEGAPTFSVASAEPGDPGAPSGDWLEPE